MAGFTSADEYESSNSSRGRKRPYRHASYQTQRLEAYFEECQHPNERQRRQLGRELGLTHIQIKFWFQNKRTLVKARNERVEGNDLRVENERLRIENIAIRQVLKDELCTTCKDLSFSKEEQQSSLEQQRIENAQLNEKYEKLCNLLFAMGISVSKIHSLPPAPGSSLDASRGSFPRQRIIGRSLDPDFGSRIFSDPSLLYKLKEVQEPDKSHMVQTVANAIDELTSLLVMEPLWVKDPTDGRYIIHRDNYQKTFSRIHHLKCSRSRFESSKEEGIVRMNGTQLVGMLLDSTKRPDLFPTIITKSMTIQELGTQSTSLSGSLQLVYEKMHILSPLVAPREFYFLRYCEQINEGTWMILEVSYDFFDGRQQTSPFCCWRLPSGCLIKDMSNGCSKITWVEHDEVDDKALTHRLYRDFVFRGLAYGAERWLFTLQRMCERFGYQMVGSAVSDQELGGVISMPEGRRSIMNLSHRMVKNLCANLTMKNKLDMPHLSELNSSQIRVSVCKNTGVGLPDGLIISAATSLWLPLSSQAVFDFFRDEKMRSQWDTLSNGNPSQEIARISYGDHPGNRISIIQPLIPCENNMLVLQESCVDPLGAIVVYAPIDIKSLDTAVSGADSSNIAILPSGFIISSDGRPDTRSAGASSSSATHRSSGGSLVTVVFQILACEASASKQVELQLVAKANALISSTVRNIKSALNCTGLD